MSIIEQETVELPAELEQTEDEILILRRARDLLSDPKKWCADEDALTAEGEETVPWREDAAQWCALGAIAWATGDTWNWHDDPAKASPRFLAARERLGREIDTGAPCLSSWGSSDKIIELNDGDDGYEQIMAALDRAIS